VSLAPLVAVLLLAPPRPIQVGSKVFTESVILGEAVTQLLEASGLPAAHRRELGGTQIVWQALKRGEIDAYVEYTGTIRAEILGGRPGDLGAALAAEGVRLGPRLGFEDSYALGVPRALAERQHLARISDLVAEPALRLGFSSEFLRRADGWPALRDAYRLPQGDVRGLEHALALRALTEGALDVTDLYSTDAEIAAYDLVVLDDDRAHFPRYEAVLLERADLPAPAARALERLGGALDGPTMVRLNAQVKLEHQPEAAVAAAWLEGALHVRSARAAAPGRVARLLATTRDHLLLVAVSLLAALACAVPLGVLAARRPRLGQVVLGVAGVVQTVPSLALLVFMIPLLGIGSAPAVAALFLYSLLPIVRGTHSGLTGIPAATREAAAAIGLPARARLFRVELPLAMPALLAGVQTAAVINVGTAALGALVGAGGYGQPIVTGIRLDDLGLILEGAVPAALLALAVQGAFELLGRAIIPRGLR
jgi:osmoprotectant transport system permease protein